MAKKASSLVIVRDTVLLIGGLAGIAYQQITGNVNPILIGVYMSMLGFPGLSNGLWLLKQIGAQQPSSSQLSDSPTPSDKSSE